MKYQFIDSTPFDGRNYYRLQQVDFDSEKSFSRVLSLYFERPEISFFPNPANDVIHFNTKGNKLDKVLSCNTLGQIVVSDLSGKKHIDISLLKEGLYFVFAKAEGTLLREKLLVK